MIGNNTKTMPPAVLNHLAALRSRTGDDPIRIRVGGNSMDSSVYVPSQTTPMIQRVASPSNSDNQPVNYGPMVWDVLKQVSLDVGGASFLIGLSLLDPSNPSLPVVAGDASMKMGSSLDGFLLGNEPDLYKKPNVNNYTTAMYIEVQIKALFHLTLIDFA
ncbi:hypothetical protein D9619_000627 [Psilocybe cf. subviscida]|uniref:Uncharacterized protein n=1 Tax=Psilocybe cf. subviscida TaxID=2480587 RepID=A0A8H5F423_9AGAR|nr:hypothetical protein D9619_000627 [Psilocybe cf. subviscida]